MNTKLAIQLFAGLLVFSLASVAQEAQPADPAAPAQGTNVVGEVNLAPMPLLRQISALATAANLKVMFDPRLMQGTNAVSTNVVEGIHYEGVTPRQVLDAVLKNNNLQMVPDPDTGIGRITVKDPRAPEPLFTRVYQLYYSNPTNMVMIISNAVAGVKVVPNGRTSQLVITATSNDLSTIDALLDELDLKTRQVLIEAQLYETTRNPQSVKGIDWSGTLAGQQFTFGNGRTTGETLTQEPGTTTTSSTTLPSGRVITSSSSAPNTTSTRLSTLLGDGIGGLSLDTARGFHPATAFLNADGVSAVLSFLNTDSDTEVIATPRTVTLDNQPAILNITRAFPIFKITPGSANTPAGSEVTWTNLGVILTVTPRISADDYVTLKVVPEVSNIDRQDRQVINGQENIANVYSIRKIDTQVVIKDGNTLVMGGLINDSTTKSYTKIPLLGDLPGIGLAFRRDSKLRQKQNLIIFITPHIVRDQDYQPTESTFLKTRRVEKAEPKESAWDSGKPYDWTKPVD